MARSLLLAALVAALLVAAGGLLQTSQDDARRQLEERFELRLALGSGFVAAFLADVAQRERRVAESELATASLDDRALQRAATALGVDAAVLLDAAGHLLQVVPHRDEIIGTNLANTYDHLRRATEGEIAISQVVNSAATGSPVMAIAAPFESESGLRVISGGFLIDQTPLAAYLHAAIPFASAEIYLVDDRNVVVASNQTGEDVSPAPETVPATLAEAAGRAASGRYATAGADHFFATHEVPDAPLRLIATVETASLYAPIGGLSQWLPWLVLALLGLVAFYLMRVLSALWRVQSELRLAGAELERSNRELQDFAGIASHDLQEPLRKIQSFGERLATRSQGSLDADAADYLARMLDAAGRMQSLIQELLTWSRVAARPEAHQKVDLDQVVAEVLSDLEVRIQSAGGEVVAGSLPTLQASPLQMRQLFQNLIGNALKFNRPGVAPVVQVEARRLKQSPGTKGAAWEIRVSDNGIGFDQEYAERIFAPFQRLHGRTAYEGTGMGLAICRRIVERHGGSLTAIGRPDQGATFVITLPAAQPRPKTAGRVS